MSTPLPSPKSSLHIKGSSRLSVFLPIFIFSLIGGVIVDTSGVSLLMAIFLPLIVCLAYTALVATEYRTIEFTPEEVIIRNPIYQTEYRCKLSSIKEMGVYTGGRSAVIRIDSEKFGFYNFTSDDMQKVVDHCKQFRFILLTNLYLV